MIPLFKKYPGLQENLPYTSLCDLPTPLFKLARLGKQVGHNDFYIKQDGLTSKRYGGNKIRKLEFLLGEAIKNEYKRVVTYGFTGSNHATATAVHADFLGMQSISMLAAQENADYVRTNLLISKTANAEIHLYKTRKNRDFWNRMLLLGTRLLPGKSPYVIPSGGSSPLGITGFVNAAFELKTQMDAGLIPEPDAIYVAMGSAGTAVGLLIGIQLLGLKTKIIPVRVIETSFTSEERIRSAYEDTILFLHEIDPAIPLLNYNRDDFPVNDQYLGKGYAKFTAEGMAAITLLKETEGILLDGTYTGKAMAALLDDIKAGKMNGKVALFWNTLNAYDFQDQIKNMDYKTLPNKLHRYFETEVQKVTD